jgi:hypothetical protein
MIIPPGIYPAGHLFDNPAALAEIDAVQAALVGAGTTLGHLGDFVSNDMVYGDGWSVDELARLPVGLENCSARDTYPFINLMRTSPQPKLVHLANPQTGADWEAANRFYILAGAIKQWRDAGPRRLCYVAPWPEVNGSWCNYWAPLPGGALDYLGAVARLRYVLEQHGVLGNTRLVFAPDLGAEPFESYYRAGSLHGDDLFDAVGLSVFSINDGRDESWAGFVKPGLDRLVALAPHKPLFVSQTGACNAPDVNRETWTRQVAQAFAATYPETRAGFMYFNRPDELRHFEMTPAAWARVFGPTGPSPTPPTTPGKAETLAHLAQATALVQAMP